MIFSKTKIEPHVHTSSRDQWSGQMNLMFTNLDTLKKELTLYQGLSNPTMTSVIKTKITQALSQLKKKLEEKPPKDRPQDIANNTWCSQCLSTYH